MKMFLTLTAILVTVISCYQKSEFEIVDKKLNYLFSSLGKQLPKEHKIILLQSYMGCGTCNEMVIEFIKYNYNYNNILFVIPFSTVKNMHLVYGDNLMRQKNVYIDKNKVAVNTDLILDHTVVLFVDKGKVIKLVELNPQNIDHELILLKQALMNTR